MRCGARLCAALVAGTLTACGGGGGGGGTAPGSPAAAIPEGNHILFALESLSVSEFDGTVRVSVLRTGDAVGEATVNYLFSDGTATNGADFNATDGMLSWAAGETGMKTIRVDVHPDVVTESLENFDINLYGLTGSDSLSGSKSLSVEIADRACQEVSGAMTSNVVWTDPCYHITDTVALSEQAQLNIEPGVTVIANSNTGIAIGGNATIFAQGSAAEPVRLKGTSPSAGSWSGLSISSTNPLQQINHVDIEGANIGVDLVDGAQLGSFANNSIRNTGMAAIRMSTDLVDSLGAGLAFSNNPGGIRLLTDKITSTNPLTLTPQATHYSIGRLLIVDGELTLEPGVDLRFAADTLMYVSQNGSVNAVGTAAQPIVISGVNPRPGFWNGIQWVSSSSTRNQFSYVTVEYGGGDPARSGNLIIEGSGVNLSIDNSSIVNSAGYGIYQISSGANLALDAVVYSNNALGDHLIP